VGAVAAAVVHDDHEVYDALVEHLAMGALERRLGVVGRHDDNDFLLSVHGAAPTAPAEVEQAGVTKR